MVEAMSAAHIAGLVSALLLGLSAGLFFAFSVSVMPGLRAVSDSAFVSAMNSINRAILNPVFFLVFVGSLLAPGVTAVLAFLEGDAGWLWVAATTVYLVGVLGVTGAVNVPLNEALAKNDNRVAFEARWVRFNTVRTVANIVAFGLALVALAL